MNLVNASDWTASFPHPFGTDPVGDTATLNRFMESVNQRLNQIAHGLVGGGVSPNVAVVVGGPVSLAAAAASSPFPIHLGGAVGTTGVTVASNTITFVPGVYTMTCVVYSAAGLAVPTGPNSLSAKCIGPAVAIPFTWQANGAVQPSAGNGATWQSITGNINIPMPTIGGANQANFTVTNTGTDTIPDTSVAIYICKLG